jgi:hypothetical protein
MSFDAGSIVAKATLDRSEFIAGLEEMQRRAEEFANHRYDVVFDVDDERLQAELDGIEQRLRDISDERHEPTLELAGFDRLNEQITELDLRLDRAAWSRRVERSQRWAR